MIDSEAPQVAAVACPSITECIAVDHHGREVTFNPASPHAAVPTAIDGNEQPLYGVACPSVTQCTAVDDHGGQATFIRPRRTPSSR
jgi:hypothetical protein